MQKKLLYKALFILGVVGLMAFYTFPLEQRVNLGLDLKGGTHLLLRVDTISVTENLKKGAVEQTTEFLRSQIEKIGIKEGLTIQKQEKDKIIIQVPLTETKEKILSIIEKIDLQGIKITLQESRKVKLGESELTELVLGIDMQDLVRGSKEDAVERAVEILRNRIDEFGVREPIIQKQGEDEIVVQLPGITDRERALELIRRTAFLEFKIVSDDVNSLSSAIDGKIPDGYELKYSQENEEPLLLKKDSVLTGGALKNASVRFDSSQFGQPYVALEFDSIGAKKFAQVTRDNVGRRLAIVLDGNLQSAPRIKEEIPSGEAVISGYFTIEKAQDLALILRVGALPAPMIIEEERTVGPLLGQDSIKAGFKASIIGLCLLFFFIAIYYCLLGLIADVALVLNLLFIMGGLGILPLLFPGASVTLTLPGIAGIVLSLGMAVDANVLINERIREEFILGRPILAVIANGYSKAFSAIIDSNITTLIAAFLLFQFGTGPIRGFAVTLTIGLLSSLFTSLFVTRTLLEAVVRTFSLKRLPMLSLFKNSNINFISKRKICYALSILVIVLGCMAIFSKNKSAFGIDFTGGRIQEFKFDQPVPIEDVRQVMSGIGENNASIQQFEDNPNVYLIKSSNIEDKGIMNALKKRFSNRQIDLLRVESVGSVAGEHLKNRASFALVWALIGILIYVSLRFKNFNFAVAGVIALFHDCLVTVGFMALTNRPIDLITITAVLSIAGYSINDTIVIYDRVRENRRLLPKLGYIDLINLSINQTLSRTLLTTFTTMLIVVTLFIFGGYVLSNFAFALFVGFVAGTYSTIFIVSPLVLAGSRSIRLHTKK